YDWQTDRFGRTRREGLRKAWHRRSQSRAWLGNRNHRSENRPGFGTDPEQSGEGTVGRNLPASPAPASCITVQSEGREGVRRDRAVPVAKRSINAADCAGTRNVGRGTRTVMESTAPRGCGDCEASGYHTTTGDQPSQSGTAEAGQTNTSA